MRIATGRDAGPNHGLLVVGEQPEGWMRGERADRAEITAIQREYRRRAVLGGQDLAATFRDGSRPQRDAVRRQ
jgi:hypothetical protein